MTPEAINAKAVLTGTIYDRQSFAAPKSTGRIDLRHYQQSEEEIYQMADGKPMGQTYYDEVEALKAKGTTNAEAIRQVAQKYGKNENAVRGGIHQYKSRHVEGGTPATARRTRRSTSVSVDDYVADARKALEAALDLIDQEVKEAKAALDSAQARHDEIVASVKQRKADLQKKLAALS
jgi:hypothetical protein